MCLCFLLMTKAPRVGLVKTRLATEIGAIHAAGLYSCFLLDIIEILKLTGFEIIVYYTPEDALKHPVWEMGKKITKIY